MIMTWQKKKTLERQTRVQTHSQIFFVAHKLKVTQIMLHIWDPR